MFFLTTIQTYRATMGSASTSKRQNIKLFRGRVMDKKVEQQAIRTQAQRKKRIMHWSEQGYREHNKNHENRKKINWIGYREIKILYCPSKTKRRTQQRRNALSVLRHSQVIFLYLPIAVSVHPKLQKTRRVQYTFHCKYANVTAWATP